MNRLIRTPLAILATMAVMVSGLIATAPQAFARDAQTSSVPTVYIDMRGTYYRTTTDNPTITQTSPDGALAEINGSGSHTIAGGATFEVVDPANPKNNFADSGTLDPTTGTTSYGEIRGRGNYTWETLPNLWQYPTSGWVSSTSGGAASFTQAQVDKRAYQMKLSVKHDMLGMGSAKTWILLANHADGSLMRNKVAMDLAAEFGLPYTPQARFIDLVINGKYVGNYLLTEKVQEGGTRVDFKNTGGILVELDNNYFSSEPGNLVHRVPSGSHFVLKDAYKGEITDAAGNLLPNVNQGWWEMRTLLNVLDAELKTPNPDWALLDGMIDMDSFARFYFIQEFTSNPEIARSSIYFYKDGSGDKLHAGPIWDFDASLGNYSEQNLGGNPGIFYTRAISQHRPSTDEKESNYWFERLFKMPQFDSMAGALYATQLKLPVEESVVKLSRYETLASASASKNFNRYQVLGKNKLFPPFIDRFSSTWAGEVQRLRSYMQQRITFLNGKYAQSASVNASACATAAATPAIATPGAFNALEPCRMLDTRTGNGAQGPVAGGGQVALKVTGRGGVPDNASAVVLNVTVTNPTHTGFVTAYPAGATSVPEASNLNFVPSLVVANQVTVKVGAGGVVNFRNSPGGTVHLVADVAGFFVGGQVEAAGGFTAISPARILDTREGVGAARAAVPPNGSVDLQVTGVGGVPANAGAVALNVTVDRPTANGHITVYPTGVATVPGVSNVNYRASQTIPNAVTVKLNADGKVTLANTSSGTVELVVDVNGFYQGGAATAPGMFVPVTPTRILDSRGVPAGGTAPGMPKTTEWKAAVARMMNNFETIPLTVAGAGGVPKVTTTAPNAGAVIINVTVANPTQTGYITTFPAGSLRPATSSVNFAQWQDVPNLVTVKLGTGGAVNTYSMSAGQINIIADVSGYYIK